MGGCNLPLGWSLPECEFRLKAAKYSLRSGARLGARLKAAFVALTTRTMRFQWAAAPTSGRTSLSD